MNAAPQQFGVVRSYDDLIEVLRKVVTERGITMATIDEIAGLQSGYASKVLAPVPIKHLGPMSFDSIIGALGVDLVVIDNPEKMARMQARHEQRLRGLLSEASQEVVKLRFTRRKLAKMGRKGGKMRLKTISAKKRRIMARRAARARAKSLSPARRREIAKMGGKAWLEKFKPSAP